MTLSEVWKYHQWATERTLESCADLTSRGIQIDRFILLGEALHAAGISRLWAGIFPSISTGLRRAEIMGLRWQDIERKMGAKPYEKKMVRLEQRDRQSRKSVHTT